MTLNFQKGRSHRGRFGAARVCGYNPLRVAVIMTLCSEKLNDCPKATAKAEFKPCLLNSRSNPQPKAIMWLRFFEIRTFVSL